MFGGPSKGILRHIRELSLHGTQYFDVAVQLEDGRVETARLGPEGVEPGLQAGDSVRIDRAGVIVIGIARAEP